MPTTNLLTRDDTLLGICQGLGEDFGFNPNWLRIALGAVLLVSPTVALGLYLVLGVAVLLGRVGWPAVAAGEPAAVVPAAPARADNDEGTALASAA